MRFGYERFDEPDSDGHSFMFRGFDRVTVEIITAAEAWCEERFGPNPDLLEPNQRWWSNGDDIYFRDEDDALQFRLRWC